jgi:hypothetical protein
MAGVRHAVKEVNGIFPSERDVWRSIRDSDIPTEKRGFIYKNIHDAYRIGDYWDRMENHQHKARCFLCGGIENMEHILTECENSKVSKTIWEEAKKLWNIQEESWPVITLGLIIGCNLVKIKGRRGKYSPGRSRLFTIIVTEAAHLIWKMRCERVYNNDEDPDREPEEREIRNRWYKTINKRLRYDCLRTNKMRYGRKATPEYIVNKTWKGFLQDEETLPENWMRRTGVLVGSTPRRPRGRHRQEEVEE